MLQSEVQSYAKHRWLLTIAGLLFYVVDVLTDVLLALRYFQQKDYLWTALTLTFVLTGLLVTQIFSYSWYWDDINDPLQNPNGEPNISGMSRGAIAALHLLGVGIFTRYVHLLRRGFRVLWRSSASCTEDQRSVEHHRLFCLATDLSMLKLFEAFLESVPQLLLQIYIVREMPSGLPTFIYLLYKLSTIISLILSLALLLLLSPFTSVFLTFLWLLGALYTHLKGKKFCTSMEMELLYQGVIGVILIFTFFNVKGQNTRVEMVVYYVFHGVLNILAPVLMALLRPEMLTFSLLLAVSGIIFGGAVLGMVSILLYYLLMHPREGERRVGDEVDGEERETRRETRERNFLQM
ncbi:XK-related protein 9 [Dissostichus eleginoides]|uniref:XK-related protein n=1 Tax=Dissostichus eleginoides TaxID=100907 RepID=A0AAD9BL56_DISEL|nr:XK-related protein 9 [Dissostichus eleginoides]